ncbi:hypothetical protein GHN41_21085 [Pseudomonas helleri]|uniref:Uncharacterized protein n=1 Tax=Pseudomonas helleri TaxID=1608996 RepID=A0A6G1W921_9PSED|nr:hypothetical protein [Pseudomonas helleri]MQU18922.1 hypothetical protein [Pseudomonas helleri]
MLEPACRRGLKPEGARQAGFLGWLDAQHESPSRSEAKGNTQRIQILVLDGRRKRGDILAIRVSNCIPPPPP